MKINLEKQIQFKELLDKLGRPPKCVVDLSGEVVNLGIDPTRPEMTFIVSSPGINRKGFRIDQASWKLDNYRLNPVVLWAHNREMMPIGLSLREYLKVSKAAGGKSLFSDALFYNQDEDETGFSMRVFNAFRSKRLNAVSAGFTPGRVELEDGDGPDREVVLFDNDLSEYSAVPVPSDGKAVRQGISDGIWLESDAAYLTEDKYVNLVDDGETFHLDMEVIKPWTKKAIVDMGSVKPSTPQPPTPLELGVVPFQGKCQPDKGEWRALSTRTELTERACMDDKFDPRRAYLFFNPDDPSNHNQFYGLHHGMNTNGELTINLTALMRTARQIQYGYFLVEPERLEAARAHITEEFHSMQMKAPWETHLGRMIEENSVERSNIRNEYITEIGDGEYSDRELREKYPEFSDLEEVATMLDERVYGEYRIPEYLGIWESTANQLALGISFGAADISCESEIAEGTERILAPIMEKFGNYDALNTFKENMFALAADLGLEARDGEELLSALRERLTSTSEDTSDYTDDIDSDILDGLEKLAQDLQPEVKTDNIPIEDNTNDSDFYSLFRDVLASCSDETD